MKQQADELSAARIIIVNIIITTSITISLLQLTDDELMKFLKVIFIS